MSDEWQSLAADDRTPIAIGLSAVILAAAAGGPQVLTVAPPDGPRAGENALPAGPFTPARHRTLEEGLRDWVAAQAGLRLGHVEQLYTFADRYRDPEELSGGPRRVSIGYLALVRRPPSGDPPGAAWRNIYAFLPWEDWRTGPPRLLTATIRPALRAWAESGIDPTIRAARRERVAAAFGPDDSAWNATAVLERYELLYEAELVAEARRDSRQRALHAARAFGAALPPAPPVPGPDLGSAMRLDHRRILATAIGRLRDRLAHRPLVFELVPPTFTLSRLQEVVEALVGLPLHKQNFRRLVIGGGLVEPTGDTSRTSGRPARLYRFRREVLRERSALGIAVPLSRDPA